MDPAINGGLSTRNSEKGKVLNSGETTPSATVGLAPTKASGTPTPQNHSQSLPLGFSSPQNQYWNSYHGEEEQMDGFRATTLVGVGGLIGWTAAAAYRWLNGGDFCMFPPPPSVSNVRENNSNAHVSQQNPSVAGRGATTFPHSMTSAQNEHFPNTSPWNGHKEQTPPPPLPLTHQDTATTDRLAEQVQTLVEALQKQSTEHREIVKRLSQQIERQQTNESMQRLRGHAENASAQHNPSTAATMAVFCKLAEIQADLSSLRRDVNSLPENAEKWDERLSRALSQVESCVAKLHPDNQISSSSSSTVVETTPVRPKANWVEPSAHDVESNTNTGSQSHSETHVVAAALRELVLENDPTPLRVGAQLLYLYAVNLSSHPSIPRYRKIFTGNESFQRVDSLKGGRQLLRAVGFKDGDKALEWEPGEANEERYLALVEEVSMALGILKSPGQASSGELLEKALACLSSLSATTATPATKTSEQEADTGGSTLPVVYNTPDPSILSPPVTKKQGIHSNPTAGFSPPVLDASKADDSFFADSNSKELPMESLVDAENVWK